MSQLIHLSFTAPVTVVVDIATGEIHKVVVDDENLSNAFEASYDDGTPATVDQYRQALNVANGDKEWPAWSFGW